MLSTDEKGRVYQSIDNCMIALQNNPVLASNVKPNEGASVNPMHVVVSVASILWVIGMVILCMYSVVSFCVLRKRVAVSKNIFENIYVCYDVNSPFILGIIKPRIYLPSGMEQDTLECVLEHEKAHLKRLDHVCLILYAGLPMFFCVRILNLPVMSW